ncbi:unnamed protein product [Zymoseptoria tritici ST99CH_3D7]|uniref:Heterokaryon incompatibility domain-containing protein n=1 Tax=Zymoseptoria tritici (strain ST99CH_3D7) TaxID=1276538 RepID=A0A1X7S950_ZYMT9|nr:unnamed protein product [Zymoseptoria tritici ST99CH_3D7]
MNSRFIGLNEATAKIARWLRECSQHDFCNQWRRIADTGDRLPTRLLEIKVTGNSYRVRLVHTAGWANRNIGYATLSHCWGGYLPTRLTKGNMASFAVDIDWDTLPKTFQDAVYTTARLEIKYIWIDALCIIQDSREDWSIEAAEMTNVYANSSVGLSADASEDGHGGLLR